MGRGLCIIIFVIVSIVPIERAASDSPPRSRLVATMLERFARGYQSFCFIGMEVSRTGKSPLRYRRFALSPSLYERFVDGQLAATTVNQPGCPAPDAATNTCEQGCVAIIVFDLAALGDPTSWTPWPNCEAEEISIIRSPRQLPGKLVLSADIYRDGLVRGGDLWGHNYITITETAPCTYRILDEEVIE